MGKRIIFGALIAAGCWYLASSTTSLHADGAYWGLLLRTTAVVTIALGFYVDRAFPELSGLIGVMSGLLNALILGAVLGSIPTSYSNQIWLAILVGVTTFIIVDTILLSRPRFTRSKVSV